MGSRNFGDSGKYFYIFTRELGMVVASASGIRKLTSRLRFILQDYSYIKVDLVRGKDFWRVTSASKTEALENFSKNRKAVRVFFNIARLLRRLLPGEGANESLFHDLLAGMSVLEKSEDEGALANVEVVLVLRVLNNLGYIGQNATLQTFLESPFLEELLPKVGESRTKILGEINKALKETHL